VTDEQRKRLVEIGPVRLARLEPDGTMTELGELTPNAVLLFAQPEQGESLPFVFEMPRSISFEAKCEAADYHRVRRILFPSWLDRLWSQWLKRFSGRN
jgi:hypothetical protein